MPPMYIGGSGAVGPTPLVPTTPLKPFPGQGPLPKPRQPDGGPGFPTPLVPTTPPGTLPAQAVRPTGQLGGFDPQYLQNLATAIGGLFSRPQGNLNFNPLGNLSDVNSLSMGFGNAPLPGLPSTMLQDAINGLAFMFGQPSNVATGGGFGGGGGGINGNQGRGGGINGSQGRFPILQ